MLRLAQQRSSHTILLLALLLTLLTLLLLLLLLLLAAHRVAEERVALLGILRLLLSRLGLAKKATPAQWLRLAE